ncbi:MAG TPA: nucleotidyltransferase family protein [Gammaproteobacteria bacterium]|jgi:molybdenum cofactor cytidylyltransferase|nr:4-diphosphocytidyl-2C-methyl-D-erythritol kinase [Chromatiales bacterium]MCP4926733.1 nucleotidyltransferase family protein [Gammaproteobacteria bacterium]HJP37571.1 nucleotidyltransferase family protein [Gammaproteobacteria bacterium]
MSEKEHNAASLSLTGIVLAAGASLRLGRPKQLVELDGVPLLVRTLQLLLAYCDRDVICVLGAHAADIRPLLDRMDIRIVVNPDWHEGLGASIRTGVAHVPGDARAILLSVCDQPLVCQADIARLGAEWQLDQQAIVAAGYSGGYGVPAIFPAAYRDDLAALHGHKGAKGLIDTTPGRRIVEMPNAAFDIDDSADLARLQEFNRK